MVALTLALVSGSDRAVAEASADTSWHQFRGPERNGTIAGQTLASEWPESGPRVLWRQPLGEGFASIATDDEQVCTLFAEEESEYLGCFAAATGEERWRLELGEIFRENFGNGPRATPTLDGEMVFALGAKGRLVAASLADGTQRWSRELAQDYPIVEPQALMVPAPTTPGSQLPVFGYAASPLVVDDLVIVRTGAGSGRSLVALDKASGEPRWSALDSEIGYSSPTVLEVLGDSQIVLVAGVELVGLSTGGEVLWRHPWAPTNSQPLLVGEDRIFVSTVNDVGAMLIRVRKVEGGFEIDELWRTRRMKNSWNSSVVLGELIFGFDNATLRCLDAATGEMCWAQRGLGQGNLILADQRMIALSDRGRLVLGELSADGFAEISRFEALEGRTWTPPALSHGVLYLRNQEEMVALDLSSNP